LLIPETVAVQLGDLLATEYRRVDDDAAESARRVDGVVVVEVNIRNGVCHRLKYRRELLG